MSAASSSLGVRRSGFGILSGHLWKDPLSGTRLGRRKKRFFVLHHNRIDWHVSEDVGSSSTPKGTLKLYPETTVVQQGGKLHVTTNDQTLKLQADSDGGLDLWEKEINDIVVARSQQRPSAKEKAPERASVARRASEAGKNFGHKMYEAVGQSDGQKLKRLVEQDMSADLVLMKFLWESAWAKRRKNEAQKDGEQALRERCVPTELLTEVEQAMKRVQKAREDAHTRLVAARAERRADQDVWELKSAIDHAMSVHLHHKTHVVGVELGGAIVGRAKEWLKETEHARTENRRRLNNGLEARPALLDLGALETAISDSVQAGGETEETLEKARAKVASVGAQRRTAAAACVDALPAKAGVLGHVLGRVGETLAVEEEQKAIGMQDLAQLAAAIASAEEVGVAHASHVWQGEAAADAAPPTDALARLLLQDGQRDRAQPRDDNETESIEGTAHASASVGGKLFVARMKQWELKVEDTRKQVDERLSVGVGTPTASFDAAGIETAIQEVSLA